MKTRTEKYDAVSNKRTRAERNEKLYQDVQNITFEYENINIDNAVDLSNSKKSRTSREDFQKQKELDKIIPRERQTGSETYEDLEPKEDRVYDIDEILKMARNSELFEEEEKKRLNTEYNILTKLDVNSLENDEMKKEKRREIIDEALLKEEKKKKKKKKEELEDKDLLNDLVSNDPEDTISNEIKLEEVMNAKILDAENTIDFKAEKEDTEEIATQIESVTLTTTNLPKVNESESKKAKKEKKKKKRKDDDFVFTTQNVPLPSEKENTKEITKELEDTMEYEESEGKGLMIAIIIITVLILLTIGFFVYEYFFA